MPEPPVESVRRVRDRKPSPTKTAQAPASAISKLTSRPQNGSNGDQEQTEWVYSSKIRPPRVYINPLRALTPSRAVYMMEQAVFGFNADLQWTYQSIERKEPVLRSLKERRLAAIGKLDWTVEPVEQSKDEEVAPEIEAEIAAQKMALKLVWDRIDNIPQALKFMALATFRGFAHLEKHYDDQGNVTHLEPVPQWYWCKMYPSNEWLFNPWAYQSNVGQVVDAQDFVVRDVEDPLDEIGIISFLRKNLSLKNWDQYNETYGVPSLFAAMDKDVQPPLGTDLSAFLDTLNNLISNGRGALPPGVRLESTAEHTPATLPFEPSLDYQDKMLVLAGTGGKLTMLTAATGIGSGASDVQERVFEELAAAEGQEIESILHKAIDEPELLRAGFAKPLVKFTLKRLKPADKKENAEILATLASAGYAVDSKTASELVEIEVNSQADQQPQFDEFGQPGFPGQESGAPPDQELQDTAAGLSQVAQNRLPTTPIPRDTRPRLSPAPAPLYPAQTPFGAGKMSADPPPGIWSYPEPGELERYKRQMGQVVAKYQDQIARAMQQDLEGVRNEVRRIINLRDTAAKILALRHLHNRLPEALRQMLGDSKAAVAFESLLTDSIARGANMR